MRYKNVPIGVNGVILTEKGILLGQRGFNPNKGQFGYIGGFVELGESLEEALAREIKEEIGCTVTHCSYLYSEPTTYNGRKILDVFFLVKIKGKPKTSKEVTAFKYV